MMHLRWDGGSNSSALSSEAPRRGAVWCRVVLAFAGGDDAVLEGATPPHLAH